MNPYTNTCPCDDCGKPSICTWQVSGPFRGKWLCSKCIDRINNVITDLAEVFERILQKQDQHNAHN